MIVLALDQAKTTGFAIGRPGGLPLVGTFALPDLDFGRQLGAFRRWLMDIIVSNGVTHVAHEGSYANKDFTNIPHLQIAHALRGFIWEVGAGRNCNVRELEPSAWRRAFGIPTQAPRSIKGQDARRAYLKGHAIRQARIITRINRDLSPDEAEAVGIWWAACALEPRPHERAP